MKNSKLLAPLAASRIFSGAIVCAVLGVSLLAAATAQAQQRVSKRYPVSRNVRVELKNISGTITVEAWNREEIKLTAELESPKANLSPRQTRDELIVDVVGDNRGRSDIGNINFRLQVPRIPQSTWKRNAETSPSRIFMAAWCARTCLRKATLA